MTSFNGTFSALLALCEGNPPVAGGFLSQRPVTRSFVVLFELLLNKRLIKQTRRRWFETLCCSLCRHGRDVYNNQIWIHHPKRNFTYIYCWAIAYTSSIWHGFVNFYLLDDHFSCRMRAWGAIWVISYYSGTECIVFNNGYFVYRLYLRDSLYVTCKLFIAVSMPHEQPESHIALSNPSSCGVF